MGKSGLVLFDMILAALLFFIRLLLATSNNETILDHFELKLAAAQSRER